MCLKLLKGDHVLSAVAHVVLSWSLRCRVCSPIWSLKILEVQHVVPDIALDVSTLQIVWAVWCCVGLCDVLAASKSCV